MNIVSNFSNNYDEDPVRFFDFERFKNNINKEIIFFYGNPPDTTIYEKSEFKKILLTLEEQYFDQEGFEDPGKTYVYEDHVEQILTIIPTRLHKLEKREYVFFPFNKQYIPGDAEKEFDICYTGFANVSFMHEFLKIISNYKYAFVSFKENITIKNYISDPKKYLRKKLKPGKYDFPNILVNYPNLTYIQKLEIVSKSKISLVHNLLNNGMPQLKSRTFEAAFCKSLMLVYEDNHNIVKDWFEEDLHFITFKNSIDLKEKIEYIISNYNNFQEIVNDAYEHALENYTVERFVNKYLK